MNPHNVIFDPAAGGPSSPTQTGGQFDRTFSAPGTYHYACTLHAGMVGSIVVR